MDYQNFTETAISKQDVEFAKEFERFVNGRMRSADDTVRELTRALPPAADVQGVHRLHAPTGVQLSERTL